MPQSSKIGWCRCIQAEEGKWAREWRVDLAISSGVVFYCCSKERETGAQEKQNHKREDEERRSIALAEERPQEHLISNSEPKKIIIPTTAAELMNEVLDNAQWAPPQKLCIVEQIFLSTLEGPRMDILCTTTTASSGLLLRARRRSLGSPGELDKVSMVLLLVSST